MDSTIMDYIDPNQLLMRPEENKKYSMSIYLHFDDNFDNDIYMNNMLDSINMSMS